MFESIINFFKKLGKSEKANSKDTAKERLHLVLAQDRANISADFLEMMKQEIIEVIKKYIEVDEKAIDVRLTNKPSEDGTVGAPSLYANIPIVTIKNEARKMQDLNKEETKEIEPKKEEKKVEEKVEDKKTENEEEEKSDKKENKKTEKVEKKNKEVKKEDKSKEPKEDEQEKIAETESEEEKTEEKEEKKKEEIEEKVQEIKEELQDTNNVDEGKDE